MIDFVPSSEKPLDPSWSGLPAPDAFSMLEDIIMNRIHLVLSSLQ